MKLCINFRNVLIVNDVCTLPISCHLSLPSTQQLVQVESLHTYAIGEAKKYNYNNWILLRNSDIIGSHPRLESNKMSFTEHLSRVHGGLWNTNVKQEAVDILKDFPVRPDDAWICTYAKSGTTWMQQIVKFILSGGKDDGKNFFLSVPWLEYLPNGFDPKRTPEFYDSLKQAPSPRVFKSHYRYDSMPYGSKLPGTRYRCIYVARNPKDVAVSYYHHVQGFTVYPYKPSWDEVFDLLLRGEIEGGDWFEHVLSFWARKDDDNILFLKYKDMKKDLPTAVAAVAKFLGFDLTQDVIDAVVKNSEFRAMKENPYTTFSWAPGTFDPAAKSPFIRKGEVGDWKNYFTPEQSAQFDAIYAERMKGTGLDFDFE